MDSLSEARSIINETDRAMAAIFVRRMAAGRMAAEYKQAHGLPILDEAREREVLERNAALLPDEALRPYYRPFLQGLMDLSKDYQRELLAEDASRKEEDR